MSQQPKRSTRQHRSPKYLQSAESELNNTGCSFTNSARMSNLLSRQNRAYKLTVKDAGKLLTKFLNTTNQRLKQSNYMKHQQNKLQKKQHLQKKSSKTIQFGPFHIDNQRSKIILEQNRVNFQKNTFIHDKSKENTIYNHKQLQKTNSISGIPEKIKQNNTGISYQRTPSLLSKILTPSHAVLEQQMLLQKSFKLKKNYKIPQKKYINNSEIKLFKRSAYHVAIAYHIHLKKLKSEGYMKDVDPTHQAKIVKGQLDSQKLNPDNCHNSTENDVDNQPNILMSDNAVTAQNINNSS